MTRSVFDEYKNQIETNMAKLGSQWDNFGEYLGDGIFSIYPGVITLLPTIKNLMQNVDNRFIITSMVQLNNRQLLINFDMAGTGNH